MTRPRAESMVSRNMGLSADNSLIRRLICLRFKCGWAPHTPQGIMG